jgi:glyoxylase-like metal-dependent hydrolase (beta-lactamase superfamily II)
MTRTIRLMFLGLAIASLGYAQQKKQTGFPNDEYELVKVAEGVHAFIAPEPNAGVVQGNSTVIIGEESVLVIDSGQFPSLADRMIADIRKLTDKPVRYLINTHWHGDHNLANSTYKEAFPGIAIISTEFTRQKIAEINGKFLTTQLPDFPRLIKHIRTRVAEGKFSSGKPMTEEDKRNYSRDADTLEHVLPEFQRVKLVPPNIGFEKELDFDLGKRDVKVLWLGRGNTAGDAVTWIPDAKVLVTGDTVVYPTPYGIGSYYTEWPAVLQKMIDMNAVSIVPGHGPVMKDATYLKTLIELLNSLTSQVKQAVAKGLSVEDTRKQVNLGEFEKRLAGNDPDRQHAFRDYFVRPAVDRAYDEAKGQLKPEGIDE